MEFTFTQYGTEDTSDTITTRTVTLGECYNPGYPDDTVTGSNVAQIKRSISKNFLNVDLQERTS